MITLPDRMLRQFLAGALDPPEHEAVERALAADPSLHTRLATLLAATPAVPEAADRWSLPPPGVVAGLRGTVEAAPVMGLGPSEDWVVLRLDIGRDRDADRVVVLERHGEDWTVVFPATADEETRVESLPREGDLVRIDLRVEGHRAAVVLVPPEWPVDWSKPPNERWERVRAQLGELPVLTFRGGR